MIHWFLPRQSFTHRVNRDIRSWLTENRSLTQRLHKLSSGQLTIKLLEQRWQRPHQSEARLLGIKPKHKVLVRQIYLICAGKTYVYARSLIPYSSLHKHNNRLKYLGNKSMGSYLFTAPSFRRIHTEWTQLTPASRLEYTALRHTEWHNEPIWGRRSLYRVRNKPLLVSEFFLPPLLKNTSPDRA